MKVVDLWQIPPVPISRSVAETTYCVRATSANQARGYQLRKPLLAFLARSLEKASILTPMKMISNPPRMVSWRLGCTRNRHCPVRIVHSPRSPWLLCLFLFLVDGAEMRLV